MNLPSLRHLSIKEQYDPKKRTTRPEDLKTSDGLPIKCAVDEKHVVLSDEYQLTAVKKVVLIMASGVVMPIVVGLRTCRVANECVDAGRCVRTSGPICGFTNTVPVQSDAIHDGDSNATSAKLSALALSYAECVRQETDINLIKPKGLCLACPIGGRGGYFPPLIRHSL
eukprot:5804423-Prymnesium_polylepis.1